MTKPEGRVKLGGQAKRKKSADGDWRAKQEGGLRSDGKSAAEKRGAEKRGGKVSEFGMRGLEKAGRGTRNVGGWKSKRGASASNRGKNTAKNPDIASQTDQREDLMRINKFIAHAGFCSRREADLLIEQGKVTVNGGVVTELGTKVKRQDVIVVDGQRLSLEPFIYILLNKKSGTITTTDDERDRQTVMATIEDATGLRVYPVGRLDRKTMGLLVLTNDGDLAHRLMHPSYKVKKTYLVMTNRVLTEEELAKLREGIDLEDGFIRPEMVQRDAEDPRKVIIKVFEGRNHLIRRMIAHIGADVEKLKRIEYAGLVEGDLRIGRWRYLNQREVNDLRRLVKLKPLDFNKQAM